jgi:hypothetical protein
VGQLGRQQLGRGGAWLSTGEWPIGGCFFTVVGLAGAGGNTVSSGAGAGVMTGTLIPGTGTSGAGLGHAVACFNNWVIWMHVLVMLEPQVKDGVQGWGGPFCLGSG